MKVLFTHDPDGKAISTLSIDEENSDSFEYVKFIRHLYENPSDELTVSVDESYSEEEKEKLEEMIKSISDKVVSVMGKTDDAKGINKEK